MRTIVLYLTVLGYVIAVPNGYYHQESNYKSSSSVYKNNELQHKTDDQGHYRKDGDLEGRVKPRIDANSEHSEYVNPNLRNNQYSGYGAANTDMNSYGHMNAGSTFGGQRTNEAEGYASQDRITGSSGAYSGGYSGSSSYGYGANNQRTNTYGTSYSSSSNIETIISRLKQELERDLQEEIREHNAYSQSRVDINELERQLRQNLTEKITAELLNRYGQQTIRDGMSYTITGGRLQSNANYNYQDLANLKTELENSLLGQLRSRYNQRSSYTGSNYNNYYYTTSTARPTYHPIYPSLPYSTTSRSTYDYTHSNNYNNQFSTNIQYTPVSNPQSISAIASDVQNELDATLNQLLDDVQRKYFTSRTSYQLTNTDIVLRNMENELKSNISYLIEEHLRRNYGTQIQKDGYTYSVGSNGQTSVQQNYAIRDLESLKSQMERNLIEKLNRNFQTYKNRWLSQSTIVNYGTTYGSTPRYDTYTAPIRYVYTTPRPYYQTVSQVKGGNANHNQYEYISGARNTGYEISGGTSSSSGNIVNLQRQLQDDLSRQLQAALNKNYNLYSSSGPQNYQTSLQYLTDEINRNLTKNLQEYSASASYSASGNFDQAQMENLRNQLQENLLRQLQQNLQQHYQTSSSYSASSSSSSSSNYRPVRGFQTYNLGQYKSGGNVMVGEDCNNDYPNEYRSSRMKRSFYQPYNRYGINNAYTNQYSRYGGRYGNFAHSTPQPQVQDSDLTQTVNSESGSLQFGHGQEELGQEIDDYDLTQQVENSGFGNQQVENLGVGNQQINHQPTITKPTQFGQEIDDSDQTQEVENLGFGNPEIYQVQTITKPKQKASSLTHTPQNWRSENVQFGQEIDDSDQTQQAENFGFGNQDINQVQITQPKQENPTLTHTAQNSRLDNIQFGQEIDDSDQTQQVEDFEFGNQQINHQVPTLTEPKQNSALTPTAQNSKLEHFQFGQEIDDSDQTQQVENLGFENQQINHQVSTLTEPEQNSALTHTAQNSQQENFQFGQEIDDSDQTQQVENLGFENQQINHQVSTLTEPKQNSALTHTAQNSRQENVQFGQEIDDSDQTQQVENLGFENQQINHQVSTLTEPKQNSALTHTAQNSRQENVQFGQEIDDSDQIQQVDNLGLGNYAFNHQIQTVREPEQEGSALTNTNENSRLENVQFGQEVDDSDQTQKVENSGFGKQQINYQEQTLPEPKQEVRELGQAEIGQQVDDSELNQQTEEFGFGKLHNQDALDQTNLNSAYHSNIYGNNFLQPEQRELHQIQQLQVGQQLDEFDTTQVDNSGFGKLDLVHSHNQNVQQPDDSDLSQQTQEINYGKLKTDETDLTHKVENTNVGSAHRDFQQNIGFGSTQQVEETYNLGTESTSQEQTNHPIQKNEFIDRIEMDLSKQLEAALQARKDLNSKYGTFSQVSVQDISREIENNITKKIRDIYSNGRRNGYTYSTLPENDSQYLLNLKQSIQKDLLKDLEQQLKHYYASQSEVFQSHVSEVTSQNNKQKPQTSIIHTITNNNNNNVHTTTQQGNNLIHQQPEQSVFTQLNLEQLNIAMNAKAKLLSQLKNAIQKEYIAITNPHTTYQQLLNDLQKNITTLFTSDYFVSDMKFTAQQIIEIKKQILNELMLELQMEIRTANDNKQKHRQGQRYYIPEIQSQITEDEGHSHVTQQVENQYVSQSEIPSSSLQFQNRPLENQQPTIQHPTVAATNLQYGHSPRKPFETAELENKFVSQSQVPSDDLQIQHKPVHVFDYNSHLIHHQVEDTAHDSQFGSNPREIINQHQIENQFSLPVQIPSSDLQVQYKPSDIFNDNSHLIRQQAEDTFISQSQLPTNNLQIGTRPQKVKDSNIFLQSEIERQQIDSHNQKQYGIGETETANLPTLNQVIDQQRELLTSSRPFLQVTTKLPELQQTDQQSIQREQHLHNNVGINAGDLSQVPSRQSNMGQWFGVTNQEQMITQQQSRQEAEEAGDQLIEALRRAQQNKKLSQQDNDNTPDSSHVHGYGGNRQFNGQSYRSNHYVYSANYGGARNRLNGYQDSISSVDLEGQKPKPTIQTGQYTNNLHYGQQETVPQHLETTSDIKPIEESHANIAANTEFHTGVKGHGRFVPHRQFSYQQELPVETELSPSPVEEPRTEINTREETTMETINEQNQPWWKRFGNKVKQGALNVKEKLVG